MQTVSVVNPKTHTESASHKLK